VLAQSFCGSSKLCASTELLCKHITKLCASTKLCFVLAQHKALRQHNACMYACMYACMHACIYACMHVCMHACMYAYMHACMHACMYACMYACMHACMYTRMYACMYARMHARMSLKDGPSRTHEYGFVTPAKRRSLLCQHNLCQHKPLCQHKEFFVPAQRYLCVSTKDWRTAVDRVRNYREMPKLLC